MPTVKRLDLYPLRFREIFKKKIWGGNKLRKILKKPCPAKTGESVEIVHRDRDTSVVASGSLKGKSITTLIEKWPREILGDDQSMRFSRRFPLIVKFLNCADRLSVQVHPPDEFAQRYEIDEWGKTEAWYVLHAPKGAAVIRGVLPGTTISEFEQHLRNNTLEECLNVVDVKDGDVIFLPPGTIHTAYGDVILLEVQQNSDLTYRIHDWGRVNFDRKPRRLDLEKAMKVIDFNSMGMSKYKPIRVTGYSYSRKLLIKSEKFVMEMMDFTRRRITEKENRARFHLLTVVAGAGKFHFGPKKKKGMPFKLGQTYLIPAYLGEYDISSRGSCTIVYTYIA